MNASVNDPVSVIIAVHNEARTLEREILSIHEKILSRLPGSELIVAEDGSTDGTKDIILKYVRDGGVIHSTSAQRQGYAKAMKDAMRLAKNPYIFFSDTGGKFDFGDFWKLYDVRDKYSLVIGARANRSDQLYRRFLTGAYNFLLKKYFKIYLQDADSGFRLYDGKLAGKLGSEEWVNTALIGSELTLRAIFSGARTGYVPVAYRKRSGISRGLPPHQTVHVIISVLKNFPGLKRTLSSGAYPKFTD